MSDVDVAVTVVTDATISADASAAVGARVKIAFAFALRANGWTHPDRLATDPIELRIATLARGTAAQTTGPRVFSVAPDVLTLPDADGVLAHELTHLQDMRAAASGIGKIPRYLEEGKALTVGRQYREQLQACVHDAERARVIGDLTGAQVAEALRGFRDGAGLRAAARAGNVFRWMSVAVFFIEYLRTRPTKGFPDVVTRLSRVWERIGAGEPFDPAFAAIFGQPLEDLEHDYVTFVTSTEDNPTARLSRTAYATSCVQR